MAAIPSRIPIFSKAVAENIYRSSTLRLWSAQITAAKTRISL